MPEPDPNILHDLSIDFQLTGVGWARCTITAGGTTKTVSASYLSDALGQLAAATLLLRMGAPSARVSFDEEPGEYRWGFDWHRSPDGNVTGIRLRIWWFNELWGHRPDDAGESILDTIVDGVIFYRDIRRMLDDVLARYSETGYHEKWAEYPFPKGVQESLYAMLDKWPG